MRCAAALLVACFLIPTAVAQQESFGVTPSKVIVEDAQPGVVLLRTVTVQNNFNTTTTLTVDTDDEAGAWTTVTPGNGTQVPPRSHEPLELRIAVPPDAFVGMHRGEVRIIAEAKDSPSQSGLAVRYAVTVVLEVTVGGEAREALRLSEADVADVEVGDVPCARALVVNEGNVASTVEVAAEAIRFGSDEVVAGGFAEVDVVPGEKGEVCVPFDEDLPEGQYVARVTARTAGGEVAGGRVETVFKVVAPGALGKEGILRFLRHEPRAEVGTPVRIEAVFENIGAVTIARAKATIEVTVDGRLAAVLESEPLVAPVGEPLGLVVFYTPENAGRHTLTALVTYDGFRTLPNESFIEVAGTGSGGTGLWIGLAVTGILAVAAYAWWRRRR